jgi:hypothetical protein
MGNTNRYVTGMILAAAIIAFGGFFFLRGAVRTMKQADFDMSYIMPRPKSALYNFFFGLEGREIVRKEINPFKDKKDDDKKLPLAKNAPKLDAKAQEAAKKAAQQKAATAAATAKKAEVKVNVVNAAPTSPLQSGDLNPNAQNMTTGAAAAQGAVPGQAGEAKKDTMSASQWRALVGGQPTKENVAKLINAFNNKEVDANTLYLIMNDLLQSSNSETQGMGLVIAQNVPSLKSFSTVSTNYEKLDVNGKKTADSILMSYMQGSKLSILALALQSEESQVVTHAAQVMVSGLEQAKNGQNKGGTRVDSGRGVVASGAKNTYSQFVSIFENLTKSSDATVAGLAQNALTQIQSLSNT